MHLVGPEDFQRNSIYGLGLLEMRFRSSAAQRSQFQRSRRTDRRLAENRSSMPTDDHSGEDSRETPLPGTVIFQAAVVLMLWCVVPAPMADAWATALERVEFESASQRRISDALI